MGNGVSLGETPLLNPTSPQPPEPNKAVQHTLHGREAVGGTEGEGGTV